MTDKVESLREKAFTAQVTGERFVLLEDAEAAIAAAVEAESRRWLPVSICSAHRRPEPECATCRTTDPMVQAARAQGAAEEREKWTTHFDKLAADARSNHCYSFARNYQLAADEIRARRLES